MCFSDLLLLSCGAVAMLLALDIEHLVAHEVLTSTPAAATQGSKSVSNWPMKQPKACLTHCQCFPLAPATVGLCTFPSGPGGDATYNFYRSTAKSTTIPTNQATGADPGLAPGGAGTPAIKGSTVLFTCSFACMRPRSATRVLTPVMHAEQPVPARPAHRPGFIDKASRVGNSGPSW